MSKGGGIKVLHVNKAVLPEFAHTKSEFRAERKAALQDLDELERLRCRVKSISQESSAEYVPQFEIVLRSKALRCEVLMRDLRSFASRVGRSMQLFSGSSHELPVSRSNAVSRELLPPRRLLRLLQRCELALGREGGPRALRRPRRLSERLRAMLRPRQAHLALPLPLPGRDRRPSGNRARPQRPPAHPRARTAARWHPHRRRAPRLCGEAAARAPTHRPRPTAAFPLSTDPQHIPVT